MPFIVSGTLADILRNQRVSLPEARRIISQIGDALTYAHARGMIHLTYHLYIWRFIIQ